MEETEFRLARESAWDEDKRGWVTRQGTGWGSRIVEWRRTRTERARARREVIQVWFKRWVCVGGGQELGKRKSRKGRKGQVYGCCSV